MKGSAGFGADDLRDCGSHDSVEECMLVDDFLGEGSYCFGNSDRLLFYVAKLAVFYEGIMGIRIGTLLSFATVGSGLSRVLQVLRLLTPAMLFFPKMTVIGSNQSAEL